MWQKYQVWFIGTLVLLFVVMIVSFASASNPASNQTQKELVQSTSNHEVLGNETKTKQPVIEKKTVTETQPVPFESTTVNDTSLEKGKTAVRTAGVSGVKTFTYEVTYTDGVEANKALVSEAITTQPVTQVTAVGTKVAKPNCDSNYSGACVPIASDVDCAGGSGNGPAYVSGPVYVVGVDIYDLDRDGNGVACQ